MNVIWIKIKESNQCIIDLWQELAKLEKKVETVMEKYPDFHVTQGKKVHKS